MCTMCIKCSLCTVSCLQLYIEMYGKHKAVHNVYHVYQAYQVSQVCDGDAKAWLNCQEGKSRNKASALCYHLHLHHFHLHQEENREHKALLSVRGYKALLP